MEEVFSDEVLGAPVVGDEGLAGEFVVFDFAAAVVELAVPDEDVAFLGGEDLFLDAAFFDFVAGVGVGGGPF